MKFKKLLITFILTFQIYAEPPKNILFVGNSYLYYNNSVHNYVEFLLREFYGTEIETKLSAIGGSRLHHHNIDHLLEPNNLNLDQQIDLLIMQGGSTEVIAKKDQDKILTFLNKTTVEELMTVETISAVKGRNIMENRPYSSLRDFRTKIEVIKEDNISRLE